MKLETCYKNSNACPLQQRELLSLYYLENLSVDQLAQVLGIPAGTVKSRLYNARNMLRQQIHDSE